MKAINIKWDIDHKDDKEFLSTEMEIPLHIIDQDEISNWLSDETGFCHDGFELTIETIDDIINRFSYEILSDETDLTIQAREMCKKWLLEYQTANELTLNELDEFCQNNLIWLHNEIFPILK